MAPVAAAVVAVLALPSPAIGAVAAGPVQTPAAGAVTRSAAGSSASVEAVPADAAVHGQAAKAAQAGASERWTSTMHAKRLPDGNTRVELFSEPTFRRTAGGWVPLTADVEQHGDRVKAPGGARPLELGSSVQDFLTMDLGSGPVRVVPSGLSIGKPSVAGSVITYAGVAADTDLRLEVLPTGYREETVLRSAASPREFVSDIADPGHRLGEPARQADGSYVFSTVFPDGLQMKLGAPYAYSQAAGPEAADHAAAGMVVTVTPGGYRVVKTLDAAWAARSTFPIVLDPTVVWVPDLSRGYAGDGWAPICDALFSNPYGPFYNTDSTIRAGVSRDSNNFRVGTLGYFDLDVSVVPPGTRILSAALDLAWYADVPGNDAGAVYELHEYLQSRNTVVNGCRLTNGPQAATGSFSTASAANWDVTGLVQKWVNDPSTNNGVIIYPVAIPTAENQWSSSHGPRLPAMIIDYAGPETPSATLADRQIAGTPSPCTTVDPPVLRLDPVNTRTGRLVESNTDADVSGGPLPLQMRRSYDSGSTQAGVLGVGWTHGLEARLHYDDVTGYATVDTGSGNTIGFARQPDGTFLPDVGVTADLVQSTDGFTLSMPCSGVSYRFTAGGALTSIVGQTSGYQLTIGQDADGQPATVTDSDGKTLTFSYANGLLDRVTVQDGRYVQYGYTAGRLTSVRSLDGVLTTYRYDTSGHLDQTTTGDRTVTNVYDQATGRVASQTDGEGNTTTFAWDPATQTATTTYPGGGVATDVYSGNFLIRSTDRSGAMVQFTYDSNGQIATVSDPLGRLTTMTYDAATGLMAERIGPAPQNYREAWSYTGDGRLLTYTDRDGKVSSYTYDGAGRLETFSDPLGRTRAYTYDAQGRTQTITDPRAKAPGANPADFLTAFSYDTNGYLRTTTNPLGSVTTTVYDALGRLISVADGEGGTSSFTYTPSGQIQTATEPRGNLPGAVAADYTRTNTYNIYGELETSTDAAGGVTSYTYDRAGHVKTVTDPLSRVTRYDYDADGNVLRTTDPTGAVTSFTYDLGGRRTTMTTPRGNALPDGQDRTPYTWTYTYDKAGNQTQVSNPLGGPQIKTYDAYDRVTSVKTPLRSRSDSYDGIVYDFATTRLAYDGRGNVVSQTDPHGGLTTYVYDDASQLVASTSARGNLSGADPAASTTHYEYDLAGNQTAVIDPLGHRTTYQYDAADRLTAVTDPRGNLAGASPQAFTTRYGYDRAGRQTSVTDPTGATATVSYDATGNVIGVTDPRGNVSGGTPAAFTTAYAIDRLGQVQTETAPGGAVTKYGHDAVGNIVTRTDANGHATTYTYDGADRVLSRTSPTGQVWQTTYDPDGQVSTQTNPAGSSTATAGDGTTTYQRDPLGRVTLVDYSDTTPDVTYVYGYSDGTGHVDGRPLSISSNGVTYAYNWSDYSGSNGGPAGLLNYVYASSTGTTATSSIYYYYDALGFLTQRQTSFQGDRTSSYATTDYTYDSLDRVSSVGTGATAVTLGYDAAGNLATLTTPAANGYTESRTYDSVGRIATVTNTRGATTLSSFAQTYDPASNPASSTTVNGGSTTRAVYSHDAAGRLTDVCYAATCAGATARIAYAYDPVGNRTSETRTGVTAPGTTTYAYNAADQLQSTTLGTAVTKYTYDLNGNQTTAGARTFTYDLANRVVSTKSGSTTTTYTYDPNGNRRTQTTGNTTAGFTWDTIHGLPELAAETDAKNAVTASYTNTPDGSPLTLTTAAGTFYYHHDPLGSVSNVTNATGVTQASYTYDPFGAQQTAVLAGKAPTNPMRYAGQYLDATGLYNLRARLYNPTVGQFTTLDPLVDTTNTPYSYGANSPLRYTDPSGLSWDDVTKFIRGAGRAYDQATTAMVWAPVKFLADPGGELDKAFVEPCKAGINRFHGDGGAGLAACIDNLNPLAQIGRGIGNTINALYAGCYYDAGQAIVPPFLQAGAIATSFIGAEGAGALTKLGTGTRGVGNLIDDGAIGAAETGANAAADVADLLDGLPKGKNTGVRTVGTDQELADLYGTLSRGGTPVEVPGYKGSWKELPDGTRVGLRDASKSGGRTIDIKLPDGTSRKVHIDG